jgi:hypothetical protein
MSPFDAGIAQAFHIAAAELGMATAAWLFVREVATEGGAPRVAELRDHLGRDYPVLDAVAAIWLTGRTSPTIDPAGVIAVCARARRLVIVGLETAPLDALVPLLPGVEIALLAHGDLGTDWLRVVSNYEGRLTLVDLSSFQRFAGKSSVLLTFAYGQHGEGTYVGSSWLRVNGPDVRTQFRSIVAWDVLGAPMYVYPRWLVAAALDDFSHLLS